MISDDRAEKALRYLAESDEPAADLFVEMEKAEQRAKEIKDAMFLHSEGSIEKRKAEASGTAEYRKAMDEYYEAAKAYKAVANKRASEELIVRAWQTLAANRRQGGI